MKTRILIDIDGVLNATLAGGADDHGSTKMGRAHGYMMRWNTNIIDQLNALDAELIVASTWRDLVNSELHPLMGIGNGNLRVIHPKLDPKAETWAGGIRRSIDWKLPAIMKFVTREPGPFIHIDDELNMASWPTVPEWLSSYLSWAEANDGLVIGPNEKTGITPVEMQAINEFLERVRV